MCHRGRVRPGPRGTGKRVYMQAPFFIEFNGCNRLYQGVVVAIAVIVVFVVFVVNVVARVIPVSVKSNIQNTE